MLRAAVFLATVAFMSTAPQAGAQQMSLGEQQIEAQRLQSLCIKDPSYTSSLREARSGSMRASYEAAVALIQCFYDHVDRRYPAAQKQKWLEEIRENKAKSQQFIGR